MATLYLVATPIGNLEDMTFRAVRILKECDRIFCEDTRTTKKLLDRYEITTPTASFHARSGPAKFDVIVGLLKEGQTLALVSDAGTPGISDPGAELVSVVRDAFEKEPVFSEDGEVVTLSIVPIPGPSALTTFLSASGLPSSDFLFLGFLPHKKGRKTLFEEVAQSERTVVMYESPHRIMKTLESLVEVCASSRQIVVGRELTKMFEEIVRGTPQEVFDHFTKHADRVRGEFVVGISGTDHHLKKDTEEDLE